MAEKKKDKHNLTAVIDKGPWLHFMAIASKLGLDKHEALNKFIRESNDKNKGVLG